jgi:signal transduction histidine kinase
LLGLGVTLAAVAIYSGFTLVQLARLQRLQSVIVDRNHRDALQLMRIQNALNELGLTLQQMAAVGEAYPLTNYHGSVDSLRADLDDAVAAERSLAPASRAAAQQELFEVTLRRYWDDVDRMWMLASGGRDSEARALIRTLVSSERATLASVVGRMFVENRNAELASAGAVASIYRSAEINLYWFLAAVLVTILATSVSVIRFNRRLFSRLEVLSDERKLFAGKLISVQEELFKTLARELHDEFGQVLTAIGAMLQRARKRMSDDSPAQEDLREAREAASSTLERVRAMSQMLHPPVLDDYGLERSIEWYVKLFEKQSDLRVHYERIGDGPWIGNEVAIHVYRILQEALNNVLRHAQASEVWVRAEYTPATLRLVVEDHGVGFPAVSAGGGIGLISMRERAGLIGGSIDFSRPASGGACLTLQVPLRGSGPPPIGCTLPTSGSTQR